MIPFVNMFTTGNWPNPADDINPDVKKGDPSWFLKKAQYVYSQYVSNRCGILYSDVVGMEESRLYSNAMQSIEKYKDQLCPRGKTKKGKVKDKREGLYNISWDIFAIYPKFRKKIMGLFDDIDFYPCATCVDELSDSKRQGMKFSLWAQQEEAEFFDLYNRVTGIKPDAQQTSLPITPKSVDELHMLDKMGAFKLLEEIEMEMLINWSLNLSNRKELKKKLFRSLIDFGRGVTKDYTDMYDGRAKVRYVDPEYAVLNYTRNNGDDQLTEAGEIKRYSLATLKDYGMTPEQLISIAKTYNGILNNQAFPFNYSGFIDKVYDEKFNPMKCAVLDFEFESVDTKVYKVYNSRGSDVAEVDTFDLKKTSSEKTKVVKDGRKRWYRAKWVIGTDIIFDYGYQYDVAYDHDDVPRSSFTMYTVDERSITDTCKAIIDDIQIIILKLRNAEATAAPSGLKIEWGSLSEIALGEDGGNLTPLELMRLRRQSGDIVFKYARDKNGLVLQGANSPIEEITGGIGPLLNELLLSYGEKINQLRMVTGINEVVDASAPNPNMPVRTSEMARASTNDVLKPILSGYQDIMRHVDQNLALRWQHIVRFGSKEKIKGFTQAVGSHNMQVIKLSSDVSLPTMGITFDAVIDDNFRQRIENAALESMRAAKNNMPGITLNDYFVIMRSMDAGNLKFAEVYLAYREQEEKESAAQIAQKNAEMNAKGAQEAEKVKGENELAIIAAKSKAKIDEIRAQGEEDRKTAAVQAAVAPTPAVTSSAA